jgi:hypothetical protein
VNLSLYVPEWQVQAQEKIGHISNQGKRHGTTVRTWCSKVGDENKGNQAALWMYVLSPAESLVNTAHAVYFADALNDGVPVLVVPPTWS